MAEVFAIEMYEAAADRFKKNRMSEATLTKVLKSGNPDKINSLDDDRRYVNRFMQLGRADLAAEYLSGRADGEAPAFSALERIIEENELRSIAFFSRGLQVARTVCRVVIRNPAGGLMGHGTGFMISPKLLMTNNHVLSSSATAANSRVEFDFALGSDGSRLPVSRFSLEPQTFFETHKKLDFTIVAVADRSDDGAPVTDRGWISLIAESGKAVAGEPLNIIQHPAGELMQVAFRQNKALGPDGDFFIYTTDTRRGSSGSPVLNDQWQVAALHHAGVPEKDANGRVLKTDGKRFRNGIDDPSTISWVANEGVRISRIVDNMKNRSLSPGETELFSEALKPQIEAPLVPESAAGAPSAPAAQTTPSSPPAAPESGPVIGADGIVRWNFQLTFGPPGSTPAAAPVPAAPAPVITAPAVAAPSSGDVEESTFERRGEYYSEGEDAADAAGYYAEIPENLSKEERFDALHRLLKKTHHTVFSYRTARLKHLYPWIDRQTDESLQSIYSGHVMPEEMFIAEMRAVNAAVEMAAAESGLEASALSEERLEAIDIELENTLVFNCEHVVPQSWFKGEAEQRAQKSDLHHLFTCESACNSFRNNIPYFEFSDEEEQKLLEAEVSLQEAMENIDLEAARPNCGLRSKRRFEPSAGKHAVARATLYFLLRYPGAVGDVRTGKKSELTRQSIPMLLEWARSEPAGLYEKHRNAEIARVQGNRNPLIDRPDWLDEIAFEKGFG